MDRRNFLGIFAGGAGLMASDAGRPWDTRENVNRLGDREKVEVRVYDLSNQIIKRREIYVRENKSNGKISYVCDKNEEITIVAPVKISKIGVSSPKKLQFVKPEIELRLGSNQLEASYSAVFPDTVTVQIPKVLLTVD